MPKDRRAPYDIPVRRLVTAAFEWPCARPPDTSPFADVPVSNILIAREPPPALVEHPP